ncbi:MAG TPA: DUF3592 domain-containing protein [Thermoanaerobaculia bacterium]|nr:DUF3592 domain-containing protein [Thermoanaerobaculia bacterium]
MNTEVFISVILIASGAAGLAWSGWFALSAVWSREWPQAEGTIVVSDLQRSRDEGGYMYRSEVTYVYTVAGHEHAGSRARFGDSLALSWSAPAVRVVQQYKVGSRVLVRYNPRDPDESVLETGMNGFVFAWAAPGALLLALGVSLLRSSW